MKQGRRVQDPLHERMNRTPSMKAPLTPIFMKDGEQGDA